MAILGAGCSAPDPKNREDPGRVLSPGPEGISERTSEDMLENMPERMSVRMSVMPERPSEDMPERLSDWTLHVLCMYCTCCILHDGMKFAYTCI